MISSAYSDIGSLLARATRLDQVKSDTIAAQEELLSGRLANPAERGAATATRVHRISLDLQRTDADADTLSLMRAELQRANVSLADIGERVADISDDLLTTGFDPSSIQRRANAGREALKDLVSAFQEPGSPLGGRAMNADILLQNLRALVDTATDPADAIVTYFQPGGMFEADFPRLDPNGDVRLSDGRVPLAPAEPAVDRLRSVMIGHAILSFAGGGNAAEMTDRASAFLLEGKDRLIAVQAEVGGRTGRLQDLEAAAKNRQTALNIERNALDGADIYAAASRLQALQDKMDMVLLTTRRMSDLTLARYL